MSCQYLSPWLHLIHCHPLGTQLKFPEDLPKELRNAWLNASQEILEVRYLKEQGVDLAARRAR